MQKRIWEYKADDRTADLNYSLLGERPQGRYFGFDMQYVALTPMDLNLIPGVTAFNGKDESGAPWIVSMLISTQGVKIVEDSAIVIPVQPTVANFRIDYVICEHDYVLIAGGSQAVYRIISGADGSNTPPSLPSNSVLIGKLFLPANTNSLNATGVVFTQSNTPNFANKPTISITSPNDTVNIVKVNESYEIEQKVTNAPSLNASLILKTGDYFRSNNVSNTNYPEATSGILKVMAISNLIQQEYIGLSVESKYERVSFDFGATFSSWVYTGTQPIFLGVWNQSVPNPLVDIMSFILLNTAVPDAENPFRKKRRSGKYFLYLGTGINNTPALVLFDVFVDDARNSFITFTLPFPYTQNLKIRYASVDDVNIVSLLILSGITSIFPTFPSYASGLVRIDKAGDFIRMQGFVELNNDTYVTGSVLMTFPFNDLIRPVQQSDVTGATLIRYGSGDTRPWAVGISVDRSATEYQIKFSALGFGAVAINSGQSTLGGKIFLSGITLMPEYPR